MSGLPLRISYFALLTALSFLPAAARADYITATISLTSLPANITLCRDPSVYMQEQFDYQWRMFLDVDNNPATGVVAAHGAEAVLAIEPSSLDRLTCGATTVPTNGNLFAGLLQANQTSDNFEESGVFVTLSLDFTHSTMTMVAPIAGPLAGLSTTSKMYVDAIAPYQGNTGVTIAGDAIVSFVFEGSATDPQNDVQQCSGSCSPAASWYQLIDLVGASTVRSVFRDGFEE